MGKCELCVKVRRLLFLSHFSFLKKKKCCVNLVKSRGFCNLLPECIVNDV